MKLQVPPVVLKLKTSTSVLVSMMPEALRAPLLPESLQLIP